MKKYVFTTIIFMLLVLLVGCFNEKTKKEEYTLGLEITETEKYCSVSVGEATNVEHIVIPNTYNGKPVTTISDFGFNDCVNIKSIKFPDTLLEIGKEAFEGCENLSELDLPDSIELIGDRAFIGCPKYDTVIMPLNIKYIGHRVFRGGIRQIIIQDASTLTYVGSETFCDAEYVLVLKNEFENKFGFSDLWDKDLGNFKANIRYEVESYNNVTPNGQFKYFIQGVGKVFGSINLYGAGIVINDIILDEDGNGIYTFPSEINGIKVVQTDINFQDIKESIRAIKFEGAGSFYSSLDYFWLDCPILFENDCKYFDRGTPYCKDVFYDDELKLLYSTITGDENNIKILKSYNDSEVDTLIIPEQINGKNVVEINKSAYEKVTANKIVLPNYLIKIGNGAFYSSKIKEIEFNDKLVIIDDGAFYGCVNLNNVTLPSSVRTLGESVFQDCKDLEVLVLNQGLESIGKLCFYNTKVSKDLPIPDSVTSIGEYLFKE